MLCVRASTLLLRSGINQNCASMAEAGGATVNEGDGDGEDGVVRCYDNGLLLGQCSPARRVCESEPASIRMWVCGPQD